MKFMRSVTFYFLSIFNYIRFKRVAKLDIFAIRKLHTSLNPNRSAYIYIMNTTIVNLQSCRIGNGGKVVLEDVDLQLSNAEFCYLVGRSGTGKSTLLKTLYGEYPLLNGQAQVVDFNLAQLDKNQVPDLRRQIGMVFQDFRLFPQWTVGRNLSFILKATDWTDADKAMARVEEVLNEVHLLDAIDRDAYTLSGGEQQRLCIARAILNTPKLIIADEPTGNLDPQSSDEVFNLFREINETYGTATIFATHDTRLIDRFPARVLLCENQTLTEQY